MKRAGTMRWVWGVTILAAVAALLFGFWLARQFDPAPPREIRVATGMDGGAYAAAGRALSARVAQDGVTLTLVPTSGSVENVARLTSDDPDQRVDAAIVQGGVGVSAPGAEDLGALGGVFYEPFFLFVAADSEVADMRDLRGQRVAAGPEGSGVRALAEVLLADNGIAADDLRLSPPAGADAARALRDGAVDAAIFVTAADRDYVIGMMTDPGVRPVSLPRAAAYAARHRYLSHIVLPRGVIDLGLDAPRDDLEMVAPAAGVVVRQDLHPAIQSLILQAMHEVFDAGDILAPPGAFPSRAEVAFPLSRQARRYYDRGGPGFLRQYLPFWAANLIDRLWVLALPLLTLVYPVFKTGAPLYRWRMRQRITRWYKHLRRLEMKGRFAESVEVRDEACDALAELLAEVGQIKVPLNYTDDLYRLRNHIRWVREMIRETAPGGAAAGRVVDA